MAALGYVCLYIEERNFPFPQSRTFLNRCLILINEASCIMPLQQLFTVPDMKTTHHPDMPHFHNPHPQTTPIQKFYPQTTPTQKPYPWTRSTRKPYTRTAPTHKPYPWTRPTHKSYSRTRSTSRPEQWSRHPTRRTYYRSIRRPIYPQLQHWSRW